MKKKGLLVSSLSVLCLSLLALTSCGGGGETSNTSTDQTTSEDSLPTINNDKNYKLIFASCFGDIERVKKVHELFESETNPLIVGLKRELMPGFWLISRSDLIKEEMSNGKEALQALLDYLSISVHIEKTNSEIKETYSKQTPGWLIPIAVGFQGLTSCGTALNQRDLTTPHRFAEPVITLGEFKMVHRVQSINETLWGYRYIPESNLYLCINEN